MDNIIYDVWLSQALPYGSSKIKFIKEVYKNTADFYKGGEYEWRLCGGLSNSDIAKLKKEPLSAAERNVDLAYKFGYSILALSDKDYPKLLEEIYNPPGVLYVNGDVSVLNSNLPISVVGTRKASEFSRKSAYEIAYELSSAGVVVVSGGAVGIDSAAHRGALASGGKTILVLGCGINYPYLMHNKDMRDKISENGAVISEFPPNYPGNKYTFPIRNRIISGISKGVVVIEAGEKSGSLITANFACEHNRDVFVKSHSIYPLPKGSRLLVSDGAKMIENAEDILNEYSASMGIEFKVQAPVHSSGGMYDYENNRKDMSPPRQKNLNIYKESTNNAVNNEIPEHLKTVYNEIEKGKVHIDVLSQRTKIPVFKLLALLTELELLGLIKAETGRIYSVV